jgi:hypothetical protein
MAPNPGQPRQSAGESGEEDRKQTEQRQVEVTVLHNPVGRKIRGWERRGEEKEKEGQADETKAETASGQVEGGQGGGGENERKPELEKAGASRLHRADGVDGAHREGKEGLRQIEIELPRKREKGDGERGGGALREEDSEDGLPGR